MMNLLASNPSRILRFRRWISCLVVGEAVTLSVLHHALDFWGLPRVTQVLAVLLAAPALSAVLWAALSPIWESIEEVVARRWLAFLVPALIIAGVVAWRCFSLPVIDHQLVIARGAGGSGRVLITEIRAAYGNPVPLSTFQDVPGWTLHEGTLQNVLPSATPLRFAFRGPVDEQIRISFLTAADGATVKVDLDGSNVDKDLHGLDGNETRVRLDTRSGWGAADFLFLPVVALADVLAVLAGLFIAFVVQELGRRAASSAASESPRTNSRSATGLLIVVGIALTVHALSFLTSPLAVGKDGPSYLQGAAHLLTYHNLDGFSAYRGPAFSFLIAPAMALFGRNPWSVKLTLHALAVACVPLGYNLARQLSGRRSAALLAGLLLAFSPDLYSYSNISQSEVLQSFFLLLYCSALVAALQSRSVRWAFASIIIGSLGVLVRPENIVAFILGTACLALAYIAPPATSDDLAGHDVADGGARQRRLLSLSAALVVAVLPLLGWSIHNLRTNGFFGISNYGGEVLYDGWIYFGESSNIPIADRKAPSVQEIEEAHSIEAAVDSPVPTGWAIYYALLRDGYASNRAFSLLGKATVESISRNLDRVPTLLFAKLRAATQPQLVLSPRFPAPGQSGYRSPYYASYFDPETPLLPSLRALQRSVNGLLGAWYAPFYSVWLWFCLLSLWMGLYRTRVVVWIAVACIALTSMLVTTIAGAAQWRYLLPGLILLQPVAAIAMDVLFRFLLYCWRFLSARGRPVPQGN